MGKIGILEMSLMQQGMTEEQKFLFQKQLDLRMKSKGVTFALALFLPGIDRMYLGYNSRLAMEIAQIIKLQNS